MPRKKVVKKSLAEVIQEHHELNLRSAFIEALLDLASESFVQHDGLEPKSFVVTNEGVRVPEAVIEEVIDKIEEDLLLPLKARIQEIEETSV